MKAVSLFGGCSYFGFHRPHIPDPQKQHRRSNAGALTNNNDNNDMMDDIISDAITSIGPDNIVSLLLSHVHRTC